MTTDMGGTQGKSARCPCEEPAHRLFRAEFRSRKPRHGNRGNKNDGNSCRAGFGGGAHCYSGVHSELGSVPGSSHLGNVG